LIVGGSPFGKDDAYVRELQALVARSNLTNFVTFTGHLSDIGSALAAMTIFVHPGEPEPFGLVNIEAMAMGKPVIAFAHGALPEIVTPETGILVPPGDVNALAKAALSLLARPEYAAGMGKAGQARARSSFSMERAAREIQTIYQSVFSRGTHA
jgi:mannosyltransferase